VKHVRIEWPSKSEAAFESRAWCIWAGVEAVTTAVMIVVLIVTPSTAPMPFVLFFLFTFGVSFHALLHAAHRAREWHRVVRWMS